MHCLSFIVFLRRVCYQLDVEVQYDVDDDNDDNVELRSGVLELLPLNHVDDDDDDDDDDDGLDSV